MTMVDTDQLVETVQGLREASQSALAHESADQYRDSYGAVPSEPGAQATGGPSSRV